LDHLDFNIVSDFDIRISSLCYINSTNSYVRNYKQIMQNKPNFPRFSPENEDYAKKQTQFKPNQSQFWPKNQGDKANSNPKQTQFFNPRWELTCCPVGGKFILECRSRGPIFEKRICISPQPSANVYNTWDVCLYKSRKFSFC